MKKVLFLLQILCFSSPIFSYFDLSPWIVINNNTKLELSCKIEATCNRADYEIVCPGDLNEMIAFNYFQNENGNEMMTFTISFSCPAEQIITCNPMFYKDGVIINPEIKAVTFVHNYLQLSTFCNPTDVDQRYFAVEYNPKIGITTKAQPISIYVKCLNNFKKTIRHVILAALNATNWLPY